MYQNTKIKGLDHIRPPTEVKLQCKTAKGRKYEPLPPDEHHPKRMELDLTNKKAKRKKWNEETINELLEKINH